MGDLWDWADVAAVGVMLARLESRYWGFVVKQIETHRETQDCHRVCTDGTRYGYKAGLGAELRGFDVECPHCGKTAARGIVHEEEVPW